MAYVDELDTINAYLKKLYDVWQCTDIITRKSVLQSLSDIYKLVVCGDVNHASAGHDLVLPISTQVGETVFANRQNYKTHIINEASVPHIRLSCLLPECCSGILYLVSMLLNEWDPEFSKLFPPTAAYDSPKIIDNIKKFAAQQRSKARSTK